MSEEEYAVIDSADAGPAPDAAPSTDAAASKPAANAATSVAATAAAAATTPEAEAQNAKADSAPATVSDGKSAPDVTATATAAAATADTKAAPEATSAPAPAAATTATATAPTSASASAAATAVSPTATAATETAASGTTASPNPASSPAATTAAATPTTPVNPEDATFAPLSVPMYRRRQTCTVLTWLLTPLVCALVSLYLVRAQGLVFYLFLAYIMWMVFGQKYHKNGGHPQRWFKKLVWWKWMADYFPIRLHKTAELPPNKSYVFGYHPHGIISLGAFCNFTTDGTGFESKFPGINLRLLTLTTNFRIPFYGFYLTALGICDASPESCHAILKKGEGHSLLLVLGGAKESLDAHPGTADLTLKDRKGFVKIALMTGAALVPVFGFGETAIYDQVENPQGSRLRVIQEVLQSKLGFALPLVKGRGVFNYRAGLLPHRKAIDAVVGAPIECPKLSRDQITNEILDKYHTAYLQALQKLYDDHKNVYDSKRRKSMSIVR